MTVPGHYVLISLERIYHYVTQFVKTANSIHCLVTVLTLLLPFMCGTMLLAGKAF